MAPRLGASRLLFFYRRRGPLTRRHDPSRPAPCAAARCPARPCRGSGRSGRAPWPRGSARLVFYSSIDGEARLRSGATRAVQRLAQQRVALLDLAEVQVDLAERHGPAARRVSSSILLSTARPAYEAARPEPSSALRSSALPCSTLPRFR